MASVHKGGASFKGVVAYCLSEGRAPEDRREDLGDDKAGRVAWSDTRNLPTEDPRRAARVMAATVSRAEELKELAGVKAGGRALEKPVCHYSLSWGEDETPSPEEVRGAVTESLKVIGLEDRQAVMVAHRDKEHPHVHVVVNRVSVEDGRAAKLGNSYLKLSRWAERYEREQGRIRCPERVENNAGRERGKWVRCESQKPGPYRRGPGRRPEIRRRQVPAAQKPRDVAVVVVQRVDEQKKWNRVQADRRTAYRNLEPLQRRQWGALYRRQEQERQTLGQDWGSLKGRVRQWRAQGKHWEDLIPAMRGKAQVLAAWEQVLDRQHRIERAGLVREHGRASRGVEQEADHAYQGAMQKGLQLGREDQEAIAMEGKRQAEGLGISLDHRTRTWV